MIEEIWKTVPTYGHHYEASNLGNIRTKDRIVTKAHSATGEIKNFFYKGRLLSQHTGHGGYKRVRFGYDRKKCADQVGRMVLMAFDRMPDEKEFCCHNNSDPADNRIENLRWGDQKENMKDRVARGKYPQGNDHPMAKISNLEALEIYNSDETGRALAKRFGIGETKISAIRRGIIWKSVTGGKDKGRQKGYIGHRPRDKINAEIAREIRNDYENGLTRSEISKKYKITWNNANQVVKRITWEN